jgi:hypothetical protein
MPKTGNMVMTRQQVSDLPTNSDVVLVLSQYLSCLEKLRADNIQQTYKDNWHWKIQAGGEDIKAAPPKKLKHY